MPNFMQKIPLPDEDIQAFFDYSERGKHKDRINGHFLKTGTNKWDGFDALIEGKRWRGIHIHEMYEPGVLEGSVPYCVLLGDNDENITPREVVDFLKREMFRGADAEIIEKCYQDIIEERKI